MHGILLFAHGARDPAWARPFETIAARMREAAGGRPVALAYLELMEPRLDAAAHALAAQGCTMITVVPLFLGAGGHVRRDLPELLAGLRAQLPAVTIRDTAAIGETEAITRAIAQAALTLVDDPRAGEPAA
ncbi:sirohydrochlorin chelatase [Sphaerotilus uruguayifluvii]|uniref:Sirohydrochlorin cobaltochelatase n=1 Tax=Sphaerotilus uruguayifluvii TaxID=2735897 RepID=A0ABX2G113_9BURK|nr:CbiX/SirB N-terminal domain-containing protein [Leptothrix sp. C29]NRT55978.1 sirohydrochlorin cobaltochelatase [Leptothrix sp. C29]